MRPSLRGDLITRPLNAPWIPLKTYSKHRSERLSHLATQLVGSAGKLPDIISKDAE